MKNFWKTLGIATALASVVPVRFKKDGETGKKTYQSLLISVDVNPGTDDEHTSIDINLGEGLLTNAISSLVSAKKESRLFTDDPSEAVIIADSQDFAADTDAAGAAPAAEEPAATEEDFDPDL